MGIRSRLKGAAKRIVNRAMEGDGHHKPKGEDAPPINGPGIDSPPTRGNLKAGKNVPWYLQYDDVDGWDHTDAKDTLDEE